MANHGARFIAEPQGDLGASAMGNPLWGRLTRGGHDGAADLQPSTWHLNKEREITAVFAGDTLALAPRRLRVGRRATRCSRSRSRSTWWSHTNSGYPLDLNVYQAIKGVSAANRVVREGGAIILAAECWDGIPSHGQYGELLESTASLGELLQKICAPGFAVPDQWQAQIQAQIQLRASVYLYSSLDDDTVRRTHLEPCGPLAERFAALLRAAGPDATACILPQGPQTVPYLAPNAGQGAWARQLAVAGPRQTRRIVGGVVRAGAAGKGSLTQWKARCSKAPSRSSLRPSSRRCARPGRWSRRSTGG